MNQINFEQQNQMFDKQAKWNSAEQQKLRLKEAGLNPALMYGIGGEGGSSVSSGGGSGAQVAGVNNAGTQAVMMGLQAKSIESQIALTKPMQTPNTNEYYPGDRLRVLTSVVKRKTIQTAS